MMKCSEDKKLIREHLTKGLRRLHLMNEGTIDIMDSAVVEGGIIELEMLWTDLLGEDAPDKLKVLGRNKRDVS